MELVKVIAFALLSHICVTHIYTVEGTNDEVIGLRPFVVRGHAGWQSCLNFGRTSWIYLQEC